MKEHIIHPIPPFFDADSQVLILGSFPSVKSREQMFFYGHPQNRYWKVIASVFDDEVPVTIPAKKAFLKKHHIAMWDVIGSCDIEGSSDASITNVKANDLNVILKAADIKAIFVNGKTAYRYYRKYTEDLTGRPAICLPSTSPANAAWTMDKLLEEWKQIDIGNEEMTANDRPELNKKLSGREFRKWYWLKEELVQFCRDNGIPATGGKTELADRIALFLDTGKIESGKTIKRNAAKKNVSEITLDSVIESGFVCSEKHRAFFKEQIGSSFSFNVAFQKWLKSNSGKTYADAVAAYRDIKEKSKKEKTKIDGQFEYNTYIRDFFDRNKGRSLDDAIKCWKYKKSLPGHNRYEDSDLKALD